jgi:hypothetical protein
VDGRYWIVRFSTETGGGIAFVSANEDREQAIRMVTEHVHYDWRVFEAEVIGTTADIEVNGLYHVAGIYHFGGDSNI